MARMMVQLLLFALCSLLGAAHGAVFAVDLGSSYMKIALVKAGRRPEIVLNVASKRKSEAMIGFDNSDGSRLFASDAWGFFTRKPGQTFFHVRELLGRNATHPAALATLEANRLGYKVDSNPFSNTLRLSPPDAAEDFTPFSVEELMAMLLQFARDLSAVAAEGPVRDCVITVPSFFTQFERQALLDAADIAGLKVLSLIDENTAAALEYGIHRVFVNKTHRVLVYNMGALSTQTSLVDYTGRYVKKGGQNITQGQLAVFAKAWDQTLGGEAFELNLVEILADNFNTQWGKGEIRDHPRAIARIRKQAQKVKQVLSANEAIPVTIESLHDDLDFKVKSVTRAALEEMSADLLARVTKPIDDVLEAAGMTVDDLDAVELIGGGTRVPAVRRILEKYFKERRTVAVVQDDGEGSGGADADAATADAEAQEGGGEIATLIGNHLNGDEAPALGAVFHGANLSTAFRVRHVGLVDVTPFPVGVRLTDLPADEADAADEDATDAAEEADAAATEEEEEEVVEEEEATGEEGGEAAAKKKKTFSKRATLFKRFNKLDARKVVTFTHGKDLRCTFNHETGLKKADNAVLPVGTGIPIAVYDVKGIEEANEKYSHLNTSKVALTFHLTRSGISELVKAEATFTEIVMVDVPPPKKPKKEEKEEKAAAEAADATVEDADADPADTDAAAAADLADADATDATDDAAENADAAAAAATDDDADNDDAGGEVETEGEEAATEEEVEEEATPPVPEQKAVKKTHRVALEIARSDAGLTGVKPLSETDKATARNVLEVLNKADDARMAHMVAKNDLESFVFESRDRLRTDEESVAEVTEEDVVEQLFEDLMELEDWIDDEGDDAEMSEFKTKGRALSKRIGAIFSRISENKNRPAVLLAVAEFFEKARDTVATWEEERPWVTEEEREELLGRVGKVEAWLEGKNAEQAELTPRDEPAFTVRECQTKLEKVQQSIERLLKKKKPKPPKKPKKEEEEEEKAAEGEEGADEADKAEGAEGGKEGAEDGKEAGAEEQEAAAAAEGEAANTEGATDAEGEDAAAAAEEAAKEEEEDSKDEL